MNSLIRGKSIVVFLCLDICRVCALVGDTSPSPKAMLIVGGTGRVGGSTAKHLHLLGTAEGVSMKLILGGRSAASFESSKARIWDQLASNPDCTDTRPEITFQNIDLDGSPGAVAEALRECNADCVVHTAGPFQQRTDPVLLQACIECGLPYVDVCDEPNLCAANKALSKAATAAGTVAVSGAGIWPGASALMAAASVEKLREMAALSTDVTSSATETFSVTLRDGPEQSAPCEGEVVDLSFFTAGTGNAGATIVSATFLLLCQPVLTLVRGSSVDAPPWTSPREVDFGEGVGKRMVRLLDNPDVFTVHSSLRVPTLASRFATAPGIWNQLFAFLQVLLPPKVLANKRLMQSLSVFSLPVIRAVDKLVGATNAMRVDATNARGDAVRFQATHVDLEQCVGLATAAFALEVLVGAGKTKDRGHGEQTPLVTISPGVYYPADLPTHSRDAILTRVKRDAVLWEFEATPAR